MPDFRTKMHQKSISAGAMPQTRRGSLQRIPNIQSMSPIRGGASEYIRVWYGKGHGMASRRRKKFEDTF